MARETHRFSRRYLIHASGAALGVIALQIGMTVPARAGAMVPAAAAAVHPTGVLKLGSRSLVCGSTIPVTGEKFPHNASLALVLIGVDGRLTFRTVGTVQSDAAGRFTDSLSVPAVMEPGSYRLDAIASDGDVVGTLDIEIAARPPTAEPLALERARSPLVTGMALGVSVLALVLGGVMLCWHPTLTS